MSPKSRDSMRTGRPLKYRTNDERVIARREQWKRYKRNARTEQKLKSKIEVTFDKSLEEKDYQNCLTDFLSNYGFNTYLVVSSDPYFDVRNTVYNQTRNTLTEFQQKHETDTLLSSKSYDGSKSMVKQVRRFTQYLSDLKLIDRAFFTLEKSGIDNYHFNIILNVNNSKDNAQESIRNAWKFGKVNYQPISSESDKINIIRYSVKEIKVFSDKKIDQTKIDAWYPFGAY